MEVDKRIAVISWAEYQDRAFQYAKCLNAPMYFIHRTFLGMDSKITAPFRYVLQSRDTWRVLMEQKPRVIHVTNPPVFAAMVISQYCRHYHAYFIMDTHPPCLYSHRWSWSLPLQRSMMRKALVNIVDQKRYQTLVESWGGRAIIQVNPLFQKNFPNTKGERKKGSLDITVVNTFAEDEPLAPILQAAMLTPTAHYYILGDTQLADPNEIENPPENVTFTGYLNGDDYWSQLSRSHAIICLTTYPYSLLAGAKDGMMVETPLILSDQPILREYFTRGTLFVAHTPESISAAILELAEHQSEMDQDIATLWEEKQLSWMSNITQLRLIVEEVL